LPDLDDLSLDQLLTLLAAAGEASAARAAGRPWQRTGTLEDTLDLAEGGAEPLPMDPAPPGVEAVELRFGRPEP
jgi:hypothetical protein